ncbi:MAG: glycosyltransferase family 2 protein [Magnetococcales bacterium]|nr:glycosyltransferase family 2 protein [Magnetococcales bacterium]
MIPQDMKLSIIIPVYNSTTTLAPLVASLAAELEESYQLEVLLINDGSPNSATAPTCLQLAKEHPWVKFLDLSRNFGEHNAVMAGLTHCTGEAAVIIDDDLQHPPAEVKKLVEKLAQGHDVVYSRFPQKEHALLRNLGSWLHNRMATVMLNKPRDLYLSSFKAINRFLIDELIRYTGPYPYVDGLIWQVTHNHAVVEITHQPRQTGQSGYTFLKLLSLWSNMFTSFSILPLRAAIWLGFLFAGVGLVSAVLFFIEKLVNPGLPVGWASMMIFLLVLSGIQLMGIGMIGEYLGRLYLKNNNTPQFVVRRAFNCEVKKE